MQHESHRFILKLFLKGPCVDINECFDMALDPEELRKRETSLDTQVWVAASLFLLTMSYLH